MNVKRPHWLSIEISYRLRLAVYFALQNLRASQQRALLALIGITIGVAAVVALLSIGKSVEKKTLQEFETMGTQVISLSLTGSWKKGEQKSIRNEDILKEISQLPQVESWSEVIAASCTQSTQNRQQTNVQVMAVQPHLQQILGLKIMQGRFLHALDTNQKWVVLGSRVHQNLASQGFDPSPGQWLSACGQSMQIAGSLASSAQADGSIIPFSVDDSILASPAAIRRLESLNQLDSVVMLLSRDASPIDYAKTWEPELTSRLGRAATITTAQKIIQLRQQQTATYTRFLAALGGISLLVGGLGIMNIMLIAVVERRREIGIRLALGAQNIDIAWQFVMESALLGVAGGLTGVFIGSLLAIIACTLINLPLVIALASIPLALIASMMIGTVAGLYPALQAAKLDPIETLQGT